MTKIEEDFDYLNEGAKQSFQGNITSLLEASNVLKHKIDTATRNGKTGIYLSMNDAEVLYKWIMNAAAQILADYNTLDRVNRKAMRLFSASRKIEQQSRCTCKHLIAADRFLVEWEKYKKTKETVQL